MGNTQVCCIKDSKRLFKGTGKSTTESMESPHGHLMGIPEEEDVQETIFLNVTVKNFLDLKKDTNPDAVWGVLRRVKRNKSKPRQRTIFGFTSHFWDKLDNLNECQVLGMQNEEDGFREIVPTVYHTLLFCTPILFLTSFHSFTLVIMLNVAVPRI